MVVDKIDVKNIRAFKPENHSPVTADIHCKKTVEAALESMLARAGKIHIFWFT